MQPTVAATPTLVLIDAQGNIVLAEEGKGDLTELEQRIQDVLTK